MNIHAPGNHPSSHGLMDVPRQYNRLSKALLPWFQKHGRKNLPWQVDKNPYRVWLSEIMLQQTQVKTVIPYFNRFISEFPDLRSLAEACEEKVLQLWAGLGYYSRAHRLHRAAKLIVTQHGGVFPSNLHEVMALPGIGKSTAGAICSLSFDQPTPILDGNVKRVLCRYFGIQQPTEEAQTLQLLWRYAESCMPTHHCADYSQAIMDLGATLCTKQPNCVICPLKNHCYAKKHDLVATLPLKKQRKVIPHKEATFLILRVGNAILIKKRPKTGIWGGLWSLPEVEGKPCTKTLQNFCLQNFDLKPTHVTRIPAFRHTFTHFHLTLYPVLLSVNQSIQLSKCYRWYQLNHTDTRAFPKPMQRIINQL